MCLWAAVLTRVQLLGGESPLKNFGGQKVSKIRCDVGNLLRLTANISGMHRDIDKQ